MFATGQQRDVSVDIVSFRDICCTCLCLSIPHTAKPFYTHMCNSPHTPRLHKRQPPHHVGGILFAAHITGSYSILRWRHTYAFYTHHTVHTFLYHFPRAFLLLLAFLPFGCSPDDKLPGRHSLMVTNHRAPDGDMPPPHATLTFFVCRASTCHTHTIVPHTTHTHAPHTHAVRLETKPSLRRRWDGICMIGRTGQGLCMSLYVSFSVDGGALILWHAMNLSRHEEKREHSRTINSLVVMAGARAEQCLHSSLSSLFCLWICLDILSLYVSKQATLQTASCAT